MRILVTGAAGQLGSALVARFASRAHHVVGCTRADLDVTRHADVLRVVAEVRPDALVNCAAYNDVDGAEDDATTALEVNACAVRSLARAARERDAILVHYSTDFVFEGEPSRTVPYTEEDRPNPQSVYGCSKLLGEWFAADAPRHYVFRVESLFGGPAARSSVDKILGALAAGREARVFVDRVVSPSFVEDVGAATEAALARGIPHGLYHCGNGGGTTWHDLGREIALRGGWDERLLVPVRAAAVALKAKRPQFAALSSGKLAAAGVAMPDWRDAVGRYLRGRRTEDEGRG
jgi:dTDP-4-dehydrorhamnose reductase